MLYSLGDKIFCDIISGAAFQQACANVRLGELPKGGGAGKLNL